MSRTRTTISRALRETEPYNLAMLWRDEWADFTRGQKGGLGVAFARAILQENLPIREWDRIDGIAWYINNGEVNHG